jgi:hypothetical protein
MALDEEDLELEAVLEDNLYSQNVDWVEVEPEPLNLTAELIRPLENILPPFDRHTIPGPTVPPDYARIRDIYLSFVHRIIPVFVAETNSYARSLQRKDWKDITIAEFHTFLAIILYMGIRPVPHRRLYWSLTKFRDQFVSGLMSRDRFENILDNLHCVNTAALNEEELRMRLADNVWFSVQPFLDELNAAFAELFVPGQMIDIDEQTIPWKGRHRCKVYNPNKPDKWHLKVYSVNDALTGYMAGFFLYKGKDEARPAGVTATEYPVYRLLSHPRWHNKNYFLCTDNWYSSISLALACRRRGIHFCGTIKSSRSSLPTEGKFSRTGADKRQRGAMKVMHTTVQALNPSKNL